MGKSRTQKAEPKPKTINWQNWLRASALAVWAGLAIVASQYAVVYAVLFLVGKERIIQPAWVGACQALSYALVLVILIYITPRLYQLWVQKTPKPKANIPKSAAASGSTAAAAKSNPLVTSRMELGLQDMPTFVDLGLPIVGYVVYSALSQALTVIVEKLWPWFDAAEEQQTGFGKFLQPGDRFIAMVTIVFLAPLAEELIMRGWLYGKTREWLKPLAASLIVSLIFAFLHGQLNVAIATFVLSMLLCGMREITGTIWSGIILHMLVNGISFYLLYCLT